MTTRHLDPELEAAMSGESKSVFLMGSIVWPSGMVRFHSGMGTVFWNDEEWIGVGSVGSITPIKEGKGGSTVTLTIQTSDLNEVAEALKDDAAGGEVRLYLAAFNDNYQVTHAQLMYIGRVNRTPVKYTSPPSISVEVGGLNSRWNKPKRYTNYNSASQRAIHPTDSFCDDVENVAKGPLGSYSGNNAVSQGRVAGGGTGGGFKHK